MTSSDLDPVVRFREAVKRFGGVTVVDRVNLEIRPGSIHALLGANGAGKSTLIKMLAGVHEPDAGEIFLRGRRVDHVRPRPPMSFIHQDLGLIEWMTVAENIALAGGYARRRRLIDWRSVRQDARHALGTLDSPLDVDCPVHRLSRAERSVVAIVRALAMKTEVLVLDEPTASLPESETARLFRLLHQLRDRGVAMLYVTHRLDEVFRVADTVTVMRDGRTVLHEAVAETNPDELVHAIVGRPPAEVFARVAEHSAAPVLRVDQLRVGGVGPVSFEARAGEIVGMAGLLGAGQNAVGRALCGIERMTGGRVWIQGAAVDLRSPAEAVRHGVRFVTSNREAECLASALTVGENIFLNPAMRGRRLWELQGRGQERRRAREIVTDFGIVPPDPDRVISTLSGGNQQKVVLARWLGLEGTLLVLEEPTMGVDVGAKADIYRMLGLELDRGAAVIVVSSDLDEVAGVCHRALVFDRGRIAGELGRGRLTTNALVALVGGVPPEGDHAT